MKRSILSLAVVATLAPFAVPAVAGPLSGVAKQWTFTHIVPDQTSEIVSFDATTNSLWVAGVAGVDVLNASNGSFIQHIDTTAFGSINSVAIHNGIAAFAIESAVRTDPGVVKFYDTTTRSLASGVNSVTVGALPDMLTFTPNGSKLLVANEGTPSTYGTRIGTTTPRNYGPATLDPAGSVSIIDMATRSVIATPGFTGVATSGANIRSNTGMDFEPEYIAVNAAGTKAWVTLQEANAVGVLDLGTNSFTKVVGLGAKDFSLPDNQIDPLNNSAVSFISPNVKGLYMPDGIAAYQAGAGVGQTYLVMANEGDFREDDADRSAAGSSPLNAAAPLNNLRISNTDSSVGDLYAAGARSFSIRDENGNLVFDSGDRLDKEAFAHGIYDDGRSRDKGVEPEGLALKEIGGRTYAFIGLERTTKGAVAIYDVTDPANASFVDMLVTDGDVAPEGITTFTSGGMHYLAIANEVSGTTTLYGLAPVPEPETYALMLAGLGLIGFMARRRA